MEWAHGTNINLTKEQCNHATTYATSGGTLELFRSTVVHKHASMPIPPTCTSKGKKRFNRTMPARQKPHVTTT